MSTVFDLLFKGGPVMIPIVGLSVVTLACALDRAVFWFRLLPREKQVARAVLDAARSDLLQAENIAEKAEGLAIGRFLLAPLRLRNPAPETFHLALEAVADQEFAAMRKGDRLLETTINLSPLLGLLGTVTGLISAFLNLNMGSEQTDQKVDMAKAAIPIAEALIPTAIGISVAIMALIVYRISVSLQRQQIDYFSRVGSELELIYRQIWYDPRQTVPQADLPDRPLIRQET